MIIKTACNKIPKKKVNYINICKNIRVLPWPPSLRKPMRQKACAAQKRRGGRAKKESAELKR